MKHLLQQYRRCSSSIFFTDKGKEMSLGLGDCSSIRLKAKQFQVRSFSVTANRKTCWVPFQRTAEVTRRQRSKRINSYQPKLACWSSTFDWTWLLKPEASYWWRVGHETTRLVAYVHEMNVSLNLLILALFINTGYKISKNPLKNLWCLRNKVLSFKVVAVVVLAVVKCHALQLSSTQILLVVFSS